MQRIPYDRLNRLIARARRGRPLRLAIVNPTDIRDLAAIHAAREFARAALVGPAEAIEAAAFQAQIPLDGCTIVDAANVDEAAAIAVQLAARGEIDALMKGSIPTNDLVRTVLAEPRLQNGRRMSHAAVVETPAVERLLIVSDAAVNVTPTLDEKRDITQNAIDLALALGIAKPRAAILASCESVAAHDPATIDAAALAKMADRGQLRGAVVDGPLALEDALVLEAAAGKSIASPVAGRADILIAPDLESANALLKEAKLLAPAVWADLIVGARIPLIVSSRANPPSTRLASMALAALCAKQAM